LIPISLLGVFSFLGFANAALEKANASRTTTDAVMVVLSRVWVGINMRRAPSSGHVVVAKQPIGTPTRAATVPYTAASFRRRQVCYFFFL